MSAPLASLANRPTQHPQGEALLYGMVDGSLDFTDLGWQETKLAGRPVPTRFYGPTPNRRRPSAPDESSEYVAYRGHCGGFTPDFERLLSPTSAAQKVSVTDGVEWIGHWLSTAYPDAVYILDYFHVVEIIAFAAKGISSGKKWLTTQQAYLLDNQSVRVEESMAKLSHLGVDERNKLVGYLLNNRHRMRYGDYQKQGFLIGSGPIEAAHRTVLQVRMKRSGQRWVNTGCDNMLRSRVAYKSGKFNLLTNLLKTTQTKI